MARQILPTDFQDDVFLEEKRKYRMIQNEDGTVSFEDVTDYTQLGSNFGAANINNTNDAVNQSVDKAHIIDNLDDIMANQADDMVAGAKSVSELNSKLPIKKIEKNVFTPYQNRCDIASQGLYANDFSFDFKIDLTMKFAISVAKEEIVAVISDVKYRPKTLKQFPLIEYVYGSLSTLIIYPNGNVSVYIPKGGAIQSNFSYNQALSFRGGYMI